MRGPVAARTVALAGAATERATGFPLDARSDGDLLLLRAASDPSGPPVGVARTFVGFDDGQVATCFAACVAPSAETARGCDATVRGARLAGDRLPPPPGLGLRLATWSVHHPRQVALGASAALCSLALLAIATRRKPRSYGASP